MKPVIIVITTNSCSKCPYVKAKVKELVEKDGRFDYSEVDAFDDKYGRDLVARHDIKTVPTIVYDGRIVIGTTVGEFEAWLKARES